MIPASGVYKMKKNATIIAYGGVFAALAVVVMSMGTLIPIATFVCPMLCMMILRFVLQICGSRVGWAWYGAVTILSLLVAPDKEAAAVFAFLGYYPIVKPRLDMLKWAMGAKLLLFNGAILLMYWVLMNLFGMAEIAAEYAELGVGLTVVMLILGNVTFFLLDRILERKWTGRKHG